MDYAEFRLRVRACGAERCEITVEESPVGGATIVRRMPAADGDLTTLLAEFVPGGGGREIGEPPEATAATKTRSLDQAQASQREIGRLLFDLLFVDRVRECLLRSVDAIRIHRAQGRGATALRIRLIFGAPGHPETVRPLARLAALPWELLYDPEGEKHLSLEAETPIVRTLDAPGYVPPLVVDPPLRVLVAAAEPWDQDRLELGREVNGLFDQMADTDSIRLTPLEHATFPALCKELRGGEFHVLHLLGHGGKGRILLEQPGGGIDVVETARLAKLIREHPSLRVTVLNTCESGSFPSAGSGDQLAGVAAGLSLAGVSAVVAMQFPVGDSPAIDFTDAFYHSLARNEPLELAVTRGRKAIKGAVPRSRSTGTPAAVAPGRTCRDTLEWSTPVLYLRTRDGHLFDILPVFEFLGIRFRRVDGIYLAERPLAAADWARIEGTAGSPTPGLEPLTGVTIAQVNDLFQESTPRMRTQDPRVARLRLPSEAELRRAFEVRARGLVGPDSGYHYCTRADHHFPYGAVKGDSNLDVVSFQHDGWNEIYSPDCVVRPVVELRPDAGEERGGHCGR